MANIHLDPAALGTVAGEIRRRMDDGHIPGACAAVWYKDQPVYSCCLGAADETGRPLQSDSVFHMASMTKPFTGVAVMQQVEAGRLSIDEPISKYFPAFANMQVADYADDKRTKVVGSHPAPRQITVADCLTHTSGIGFGPAFDTHKELRLQPGEGLSHLAPRYAEALLYNDPGTLTSYSPIAAPDVLAAIVEQLSGESWPEYIQNHICRPLGMKDTAFGISEEARPRLVQGFAMKDGKCVPDRIRDAEFYDDLPFLISGGAGLFSTLDDYVRFARMLLRGGELDGARILREESVQAFSRPLLAPDVKGVSATFNWSYLFYVRTGKAGNQVLNKGSYGWSGAFGTHFFVDPSLSLLGVLLTNTTTAGGAGAITAADFERAVMSAVRLD